VMDGIVEDLRAEAEVAALGFGLPSRIDQRTGHAVASVNVPLEGVDFRSRMQERHGLPVGIDNDAHAAAIGEWKAGAARGASEVGPGRTRRSRRWRGSGAAWEPESRAC